MEYDIVVGYVKRNSKVLINSLFVDNLREKFEDYKQEQGIGGKLELAEEKITEGNILEICRKKLSGTFKISLDKLVKEGLEFDVSDIELELGYKPSQDTEYLDNGKYSAKLELELNEFLGFSHWIRNKLLFDYCTGKSMYCSFESYMEDIKNEIKFYQKSLKEDTYDLSIFFNKLMLRFFESVLDKAEEKESAPK